MVMPLQLKKFDAADFITNEKDATYYLNAAVEEDPGDGSLIRLALGDIARAKNMSEIARDTGLDRAGLYKALSENGNPSLATTMKIARALGLRLRFEAVEQ